MTEKDYEKFLLLMEKIVNEKKSVADKERMLVLMIEKYDMEDVIHEFMGWDLTEEIL